MLAGTLAEAAKKARYAASFLGRRLVHTNLQLLYQCNMRCQICDFWKPPFTGKPRLTAAQVEVIGRQLAAIGPQIVSIGGGEPLLHPELVRIVEILARDHFPVMICNGWFVTLAVARDLFRAGIYEVSISVDYADRARHDAQRGVAGAYDRALAALRVLAESRVHPWQRVHMISVVMDDNVDDIERLITLSRELGVTYLVTLYSDGRGRAERRARSAGLGARLLALKDRYPDFVQLRGYLGRFGEAVREGGVGPCRAGRNLCNVDCQGNVTLCIDRLDEPVGNLLTDDARTVERRLLEAHRRNECRSCWTSCRGAIETLMYGSDRLQNLLDYHAMTRSVPLG
ncbi:MAG TPA: radical SAM protein [Polyangia bacterium]|jgi:MoaA/NifB/PqqE/SkfB family radical SAM enzyme